MVYYCTATNTIGRPAYNTTARSRDTTVFYARESPCCVPRATEQSRPSGHMGHKPATSMANYLSSTKSSLRGSFPDLGVWSTTVQPSTQSDSLPITPLLAAETSLCSMHVSHPVVCPEQQSKADHQDTWVTNQLHPWPTIYQVQSHH